jgi:5-formyltetrahydrofolate cyclo-ligase
MSGDKKSLRDKLLKERLALSPEDWRKRSASICERLATLDDFDHIAIYRSFRNEVDVLPLIGKRPDKTYYFPKTDLAHGTMEFIRFDKNLDFVKNRWGVEEPLQGEALTGGRRTLIIVPALAFDRRGHRLGYGKGFYDRFLDSFEATTVGVCFSEFLVDVLPSESHDRVVNQVVTERASLQIPLSAVRANI